MHFVVKAKSAQVWGLLKNLVAVPQHLMRRFTLLDYRTTVKKFCLPDSGSALTPLGRKGLHFKLQVSAPLQISQAQLQPS